MVEGDERRTMAPAFRLGFVSVHVADLARARPFYEGVLGLRVLRELLEEGEVFYDLGGVPLSVHVDPEGACGRRPGGATGFYLQVADLAAWRAHFDALGVRYHDDADRMVSLLDPDGNELVLWMPRSPWPPAANAGAKTL